MILKVIPKAGVDPAQLGEVIRHMVGVGQVELVKPTPVDAARFALVNTMGLSVLNLDDHQQHEASLLLLLLEATGLHRGRRTLFCALESEMPHLWKGRNGLLRPTYDWLEKQLRKSPYALVPSRKGWYGFRSLIVGDEPGLELVERA